MARPRRRPENRGREHTYLNLLYTTGGYWVQRFPLNLRNIDNLAEYLIGVKSKG